MSRTERGRKEAGVIRVETQDKQRFLDVVNNFLQQFSVAFHEEFGAGFRDKYEKSARKVIQSEQRFLRDLQGQLFGSNPQNIVRIFRERIRGNYGKIDTLLQANGIATSAEIYQEFQAFVEQWAARLEQMVAGLSKGRGEPITPSWEGASWNMSSEEVLAQFQFPETSDDEPGEESRSDGAAADNSPQEIDEAPEVAIAAMSVAELLVQADAYGSGAADALSELLRAVAGGDLDEVSVAIGLLKEVVAPAHEEDTPENADKSLEDEAFAIMAENDRLRETLFAARQELDRLKAVLETGRAEHARVAESNAQLEEERTAYIAQLAAAREQITKLQQRLNSTEAAMTAEASTVRALQEQNTTLAEQNANVIAAQEAAVVEQARLQAEAENLRRQLAELIQFVEATPQEPEAPAAQEKEQEGPEALRREIAQLRTLREAMRDALSRERAPSLPFERLTQQIQFLEQEVRVLEGLLELRAGESTDGMLAVAKRMQDMLKTLTEMGTEFAEILERMREADSAMDPEDIAEILEEASENVDERVAEIEDELAVLLELLNDCASDIEHTQEFTPGPIAPFVVDGLPFTIENTHEDRELMQLGRDIEALFADLEGLREREIIDRLHLRSSSLTPDDIRRCATMVRKGQFMPRLKTALAALEVSRNQANPQVSPGRAFRTLRRALEAAAVCTPKESEEAIQALRYFRQLAEHIPVLADKKLIDRKVIDAPSTRFALNMLTSEGHVVASMWLHDLVQSGQVTIGQLKGIFRSVNTKRKKRTRQS